MKNPLASHGSSVPRHTLWGMLVQDTEQGKHCGGEQPLTGRQGIHVQGGGVTRKGEIMAQKGCQESLIQQHTNCLGEKALEPLESSGKDKRGISPELQPSHLQNGNQPCSVWGHQMRSRELALRKGAPSSTALVCGGRSIKHT